MTDEKRQPIEYRRHFLNLRDEESRPRFWTAEKVLILCMVIATLVTIWVCRWL